MASYCSSRKREALRGVSLRGVLVSFFLDVPAALLEAAVALGTFGLFDAAVVCLGACGGLLSPGT